MSVSYRNALKCTCKGQKRPLASKNAGIIGENRSNGQACPIGTEIQRPNPLTVRNVP